MIVGPEDVGRAAEVLRRGGLVAFPTETVYGLGADASNPAAVLKIFAAKGRPADHPLIVHIADASQLAQWAVDIPEEAGVLARAFWPGALTMVLPRAPHVPLETTGGLQTIGLRVPNQPLAQSLLRAFGGGIAAPSANRFGRVSPTRAEDVLAELGDRVDVIVDGGPCRVGLESTIIDLTRRPFEVLRPGGVSADALEAALGEPVGRRATGPARAPGMLEAHYAPTAHVTLAESRAEVAARARRASRPGIIAPAGFPVPPGFEVVGLAGSSDEYAHELYAWLREADRRELDLLVAVPPPPDGIGTAVRDRLRRAAATFEEEDQP